MVRKSRITALCGSLAFAGTLFSLLACGDDVTKVTNVTNEVSGMEVAASVEDFSDCDSSSIGKMMFASDENAAYVCADSGWTPLSKNSEGKDGASCVAEALSDSSGYKIVCGGDSVGVIKNGENGSNGKDGVNGADGSGCTLLDNGDGTVLQVCGTDTVTLYKALCGGAAYDPADWQCDNGKIVMQFTDSRDGKSYKAVKIGTQAWMAENLNYAYTQKTATLDSSSFCYDNNPANCEMYGRLYLWSAAMDSAAVFSEDGKDCGYGKRCSASGTVRGVCPEGWHLPSYEEWKTLDAYVADKASDGVGYALKSTSGWEEYESKTGGSNAFSFGTLPAGIRGNDGTFYYILKGAYFWTWNYDNVSTAYLWQLNYKGTDLNVIFDSKEFASSIRCVKD